MNLITDTGLCQLMKPIIKRNKSIIEYHYNVKVYRNGIVIHPGQLWTANHHMILDVLFDYRYRNNTSIFTFSDLRKKYPFLTPFKNFQIVKYLNDISSLDFYILRNNRVEHKLLSFKILTKKEVEYDLLPIRHKSKIPSELYNLKDYSQFLFRKYCTYYISKPAFISDKMIVEFLNLSRPDRVVQYKNEIRSIEMCKLIHFLDD